MTLHAGRPYGTGRVTIGPAFIEEFVQARVDADVASSVSRWPALAAERADIYLFAVRTGHELVGQIFLHDIEPKARSSLIAYHLLRPELRGRGVGARMLRLLLRFVRDETNLDRLVVITSKDNLASQGVARKNGFVVEGAPREDPENGVVLAYQVKRRGEPAERATAPASPD